MPKKRTPPGAGAFSSFTCRNCGHEKTCHADGGRQCLLTTAGQVPIELGSVPFTLCPCEQFQASEGIAKRITAKEFAAILSDPRLTVAHPSWYTNRATKPNRRHKSLADQRPSDRDLTMANRKLSDPSKYVHMNAHEVAAALGISHKSVYEHEGLEKVASGTARRLWTTKSVKALRDSQPE